MMKIELITITPNLASEYLQLNNSNRKINKMQLDMIVRSINAGKWRLTHQGVAFYKDGTLADGQHRLQAIVNTGVSLLMPVFHGIERDTDTVLAIDCGRGRTTTDSALISGLKITNNDISVSKGLRFGYKDRSFNKLTHFESCDLCEEYFDELNIMKSVFLKSKAFLTIAPVRVAAIRAIKSGVPLVIAKKFIETLITGEYKGSIYVNAVKLRNKLLEKNYNGGSDRKIAYNMTYDLLVKTGKGEIVKRISLK